MAEAAGRARQHAPPRRRRAGGVAGPVDGGGRARLRPHPGDGGDPALPLAPGQRGGSATLACRAARPLAHLLAKQDDLAAARELLTEGRATAEELGTHWAIPWHAWWGGNVEALAGKLATAEQKLRRGFALYQQMGEQSILSTLAADLAEVLHAQGQDREALQSTEVSETAAGHDDIWSQTIWRAARAKILAQLGQLDAADRLAREAVRLAQGTDFLDMRASALLALADVLRVAGRPHDAKPLNYDAMRLYEQKGNRTAVAKARAPLAPPLQ